MLVEKEVIRPGTYWYRDEATGIPRKLVVTPELTKYWHEQGQAMLSAGLTVPVPFEHDFDAHPMTPADKLKNNAGWVKEYRLSDGKGGSGDRLFSVVDIQDESVAKKLPGTIRWTSPWINSFTDGQGKEWKNVISHLALTTRPRIVEQAPFSSVAAALSIAAPLPLGSKDYETVISSGGFCLSNAGRLGNNGQPSYPIAFSMFAGGVSFGADASGHLHDAAGRFAVQHASEAAEHSKKTETGLKSEHAEATAKALKHTKKASKTGKAEHHAAAHVAHMEAADRHTERAAKWKASTAASAAELYEAHRKAADSHRTAAHYHSPAMTGKTMAIGDAPLPKGKKPAPGTDETPPGDELDDDGDVEMDDDPTNDDTVDLEPFNDPAGDVSMEEILSDLLGALGIHVEQTGNEDMFKRSLYNAAMTKIHELTGKAQNDGKDPNRQNPPGQPPNNPKPGAPGQPNPLIQQEQQPMFMSLEDINKLPDPMRGVALAMYAENQKLRADLDAGNKTANSLRDAKLKEENAKRQARVTLLGRLSPRAKADLDAMLAMPAMALSMGDGGAVVDPMAQTLAVLEKGLADLPRLLTTDTSQLSLQPQPQDADMLSEERTTEIADELARQMGCPPQKKAS